MATSNNQPCISVVTPSYNQEEFICDNLKSIKNQNYSNVEHLVFDGQSTDDTVDKLQCYETKYNLKWVSEEDNGQSEAINKGFRNAEGEIIGWLNSDDVYFDDQVLNRVARYFSICQADIIYGDIALISEDSKVISIEPAFEFDYNDLCYNNPIRQPAVFFRKSVVKNHLLDEELDYTMDYEYWMRLASKYEFMNVSDVLSGFRVHQEQKTSNENKHNHPERYEILSRHGLSNKQLPPLEFLEREMTRITTGAKHAINCKSEVELAFDGGFQSLPTILLNLTPIGMRLNDPRKK